MSISSAFMPKALHCFLSRSKPSEKNGPFYFSFERISPTKPQNSIAILCNNLKVIADIINGLWKNVKKYRTI